jgi:hypothetical protein
MKASKRFPPRNMLAFSQSATNRYLNKAFMRKCRHACKRLETASAIGTAKASLVCIAHSAYLE